jgi:hypothetical protein
MRRDDGAGASDAYAAPCAITSAVGNAAIANTTVVDASAADAANTLAARSYPCDGRHGRGRVAAHRRTT